MNNEINNNQQVNNQTPNGQVVNNTVPPVQNTAQNISQPTQNVPVQPTVSNPTQTTTPETNYVAQPTQNVVPPVNNQDDSVEYEYVEEKKSHKSILFILLLLLIIGGLGYYIYTDYQKDLKNKCSPLVTEDNKQNNLKLDSTIVQDLYQKVKTNINEDIASNTLDDSMKLYLAFRQIPSYEQYSSNCNLFNSGSMQYITCDGSAGFVPRAFKEAILQREIKKLFGEDADIPNNNIQLGSSCFGGYQYIAERGEYVEGQCNNTINSLYKVDKKLISAYAYNDTVVLKEKVRYYGAEDVNIDRLKNGVYVYTFKLDNNYNYIYVSKEIE